MAGLNNSIFDLPNTPDEVRVKEEVIKISTRKIIPKSASKRDAFPGSDITFDFTLSGNQHWLPSRSFVVIRDSLYKGRLVGGQANTPDQPNLNDNIAPSLNCQDNLWDGCQLTIGGFSLGSRTKLAPQISAINKRVMKSASWLEGAGKSAHTWDARFDKRQNDVVKRGIIGDPVAETFDALAGTITVVAATSALVGAASLFTEQLKVGDEIITDTNIGGVVQVLKIKSIADNTNATITSSENVLQAAGTTYSKISQGYASSRSNKNERIYVPPLGVFHQGKALPPARYELILRPKPDTVYKQSAVESLAAVTIQGGARDGANALTNTHVEYLVDDIVFYIAVVDNHERVPDKMTYVLDLEETEVLPRKISGESTVQENFTVSKSSFALTVALQSKQAGRNTLFSPSRMVVSGDHQNELETLRVDYAGQSRPQPNAIPAFKQDVNSHIDYQTYRYAENAVEDLAYYDTGGVQTKDDWREMGPIYHFQWRRVGDDISTNVDVEVNYPRFANGEQENLMLFHHFKRVIEMTVESGQVTQFLAQDA